MIVISATNRGSKRVDSDFYATPIPVIENLFKHHDFKDGNVLEPSAGNGNFVKVINDKSNNHITALEIREEEYDNLNQYADEVIIGDFLKWQPNKKYKTIIGNPPYKCFSSDTQCYTKRGWLNYDELRYTDEILSLNPQTLEVEWSKINEIIIKEVDEELIHFKHNFMDILCTKDHRMFAYNKTNDKLAIKNEDLILSQDIRSIHYIPRLGYKWKGEKIEYFTIPAIDGYEYSQPVIKQQINIPIKEWLEFFGLWVADGYCRHTKNCFGDERKTVGIKQSVQTSTYIREVLSRLPFEFKEYVDNYNDETVDCINFEIHNDQLWHYLKQFGKSEDKFIPSHIKELNTDLLQIFIDAYFYGDGSTYKECGRTYRTVSLRLIEDLQEVLLKLGYLSHINSSKYMAKTGEKTLYIINYNPHSDYNKIFYRSAKNGQLNTKYSGMVWCVNLEKNGVFFLRRNGKEFFSGNCALEFLEKCFEISDHDTEIIMLLRTAFLESKKRYDFWQRHPVSKLYVLSQRPSFTGKGTDATSYSWFIWDNSDKQEIKVI